MDRQEARDLLKDYLPEYVDRITKKSKGNSYICPICGSGNGPNGTGAFNIKDGTRWHCFSCGEGGDILDLIGKVEGIVDYNEQLNRAMETFNIDIKNNTYKEKAATTKPKEEKVDYTQFLLEAHNHIGETDYLKNRGISEEVIKKFRIGYISNWQNPRSEKAPISPRLIIPTSKYSYLARDTRKDLTELQDKYSKIKVGSVSLFNKRAFEEAKKPIFIVEGEIDALSIIEVGGEAVGLGGTEGKKKLINLLEQGKPTQPLILALDNDEPGRVATEYIKKELEKLDIVYYELNPSGEYKDPNEALIKNREEFKRAVEEATDIEGKDKREYLKNSAASNLQSFLNGIVASVDTPSIPTGFNKLDEVLEGGLYEGLYIIGAISSLGKTTIVNQIADQIAQEGKDVLMFSLEMARSEIMAKSISRHTLKSCLEENISPNNAKTSRGITTGKRYAGYNQTEKEIIKNAVNAYGEYAENIYILEGIGDIGVKEIRETVEKHILYTGKTPIVIVDYLQILYPYNEKATDKQNTDKAVMELKRISRDYKTPVIGISSFNRSNYGKAATMEAFKESGAIEYSSDILIGLQLKGAGEDNNFNENEAKRKDPRQVELVILKNRNGKVGDKIRFNYYPMFNYFEEDIKGE